MRETLANCAHSELPGLDTRNSAVCCGGESELITVSNFPRPFKPLTRLSLRKYCPIRSGMRLVKRPFSVEEDLLLAS